MLIQWLREKLYRTSNKQIKELNEVIAQLTQNLITERAAFNYRMSELEEEIKELKRIPAQRIPAQRIPAQKPGLDWGPSANLDWKTSPNILKEAWVLDIRKDQPRESSSKRKGKK
jgi:hypothetical protein